MKAAVFSCLGLGDGLLALILSHNLSQNGTGVDTFHPFLHQMQEWFPHLPLKPFPPIEALAEYDRFFIIYEKTPWMLAILNHCQTHFPKQTTVLNPIATPNCDYPYWEQGRFDGNLPFAENLKRFCEEILQLPSAVKENGICIPSQLEISKYPDRVIIHPTSSRAGKNWTKSKYLKLAEKLKQAGLNPVFILTPKEQVDWPEIKAPVFSDLKELASFVAQSGFMIGNDSGIGHLASCLGLPTLIICRSILAARFWRPAWYLGEVIYPPSWIPNLKGMRWRDKHWQKFITVNRVFSSSLELSKLSHQ